MKKYRNMEQMYYELRRGGEIEFKYKGKMYSITHVKDKICVTEFYREDTEAFYDKCESISGYEINGQRLEEILGEIEITLSCFD